MLHRTSGLYCLETARYIDLASSEGCCTRRLSAFFLVFNPGIQYHFAQRGRNPHVSFFEQLQVLFEAP